MQKETPSTSKEGNQGVVNPTINEIPQDGIMIEVDPTDDNFLGDRDVNSDQELSTEYSSSSESEDESSDDMDTESLDGGSSKPSTASSPRSKWSKNTSKTAADKIAELKDDPDVADYINQLVQQNIRKSLGKDDLMNRDKVNTDKPSIGREQNCRKETLIKSPSDTTLYTPALHRGRRENNMIDKILNFVEGIRLEENKNYNFVTGDQGESNRGGRHEQDRRGSK